jgi:ribonuclease E
LVDTPQQPEGDSSPQDIDLEAQLDELLRQLEEVDPETVPADYRKNIPDEPVADEPVVPEPVAAEPVEAEPAPVAPEMSADQIAGLVAAEATADPAGAGGEETVEAAAPADTAKGLDVDEVASLAASLLDQQIDATIESSASGAEQKEAQTSAAAAGAPQASAGEEAKPKAVTPFNEDDLASQIENLLKAPEESAAAAPAVETAGDEAKPKTFKAVDEDELTSQIEGLLNNVQNKDGDATPAMAQEPAEKSAEDVTQSVVAEAMAEAAASPEPVAAEQAESPTTAPEEMTAEDPADTGAVSIDQIDAMLAESAEQAIEHGPEVDPDVPPGTDELLAEQAKAEQEAEARAQADRDAAAPVAVTEPESEAEPESAPAPKPVAAAEPQAVGASAADVAQELDADAQAADETIPHDEDAEAVLQGEAQMEPVVIRQSGLKKAELALRLTCGKINRPLNRLSPEMRDTVGYAGVLTTAMAFFFIIFGVIF